MTPAVAAIVMLCSWFTCRKVHIPAVPINHTSQYVMWCVLVAGYFLNLFWFWRISGLAWCAACKLLNQVLDSQKMSVLAQFSQSAGLVPFV